VLVGAGAGHGERAGPRSGDSRVPESSAIKLATATAVVLLAASIAAAAPHHAASHRAAPAVDHQLCYRTGVSGSHIPANVTLLNQFSPNGFHPTITAGQVLCNPVKKTVVGGETFPITNPRAHLVCYKITEPTQPTPTVVVTNQFGSARLVPRQPNLLCLPSWKSLLGVPHPTMVTTSRWSTRSRTCCASR
jgi:hypothetical protein